MILIAYILWLALSIWMGMRVFRHVHRSRGQKYAAGWSAAVLLALLPFWDMVLGFPVMVDACRNRAGLHVYEDISLPLTSVVISSEPGHFSACGECWEVLARGFANEAQVTLELEAYPAGELNPSSLVANPGPTRYWISRRGDLNCEAFFNHLVTNEHEQRNFWERRGANYDPDACIAAQSLREIDADFRLEREYLIEKRGIVTAEVNESTLTRAADDVRLASLARVAQHAWIGLLSGGDDPGMPVCPSPFSEERLGRAFPRLEILKRLVALESDAGASP